MAQPIVLNGNTRDAARLADAAITLMALGTMFSPYAVRAAADYIETQAVGPEEKELATAIAKFLRNAAED